MEREEALKQIEVINQVIESSHKLLISGPLSIAYGLVILILPLIEEVLTKQMTFGHNLPLAASAAIRVIIYTLLFITVGAIVEKIWKSHSANPSHPLLIQALSFHKPVVAAICGSVFVLAYLDRIELAGPVVFMMIGILLNIYARFSGGLAVWFSWSYIILGVVFGILTTPEHSTLWIWFNSYLGISFVIMGLNILKKKAQPWMP